MHDYNIIERGTPVTEAQKAIILIHGRGGNAEGILGLANEFADESYYIAAPQATNNTWYPQSFLAPEQQNEPWLSSAVDTVTKLINETTKHIPLENVYLMGFSQGACLASDVAGRMADKFAGVAIFTGGLIGEKVVPERYKGDFKGSPIFLGTSDVDPHIPVERAERTAEILTSLGANVDLNIYPNMPHTITEEQIKRVRELMF